MAVPVVKGLHPSIDSIVLFGVPVYVNHNFHTALSRQLGQVVSDGYYLRVKRLFLSMPVPIHVTSRQIRPVISQDDAIGVDHRQHLNNIVFSNVIGLPASLEHLLNEPFHDPAADGFSRVLPSHQHDGLAIVLCWRTVLR